MQPVICMILCISEILLVLGHDITSTLTSNINRKYFYTKYSIFLVLMKPISLTVQCEAECSNHRNVHWNEPPMSSSPASYLE